MVALRDRSRTWPIYLGVAALAVALGLIWWAVKPFTGEKTVTAGGGAPVTTIALTPGTAAQSTAPAQTAPATAGGTTAPTTAPTASTAPGTTAPAPTGPAGPLQIADVSATCTARGSTDSRGNLVKFSSSNLIDGNNGTAWRCDGNGSGEYLTHESNCLLFDKGDPEALAAAVQRLADDAALRQRLVDAGHGTAQAYRAESTVRALEERHVAASLAGRGG